jgi:peroxin-5
MSGFLSGAAVDCGPSNVLKNVGGRMDRDVSMQQVRAVRTLWGGEEPELTI